MIHFISVVNVCVADVFQNLAYLRTAVRAEYDLIFVLTDYFWTHACCRGSVLSLKQLNGISDTNDGYPAYNNLILDFASDYEVGT